MDKTVEKKDLQWGNHQNTFPHHHWWKFHNTGEVHLPNRTWSGNWDAQVSLSTCTTASEPILHWLYSRRSLAPNTIMILPCSKRLSSSFAGDHTAAFRSEPLMSESTTSNLPPFPTPLCSCTFTTKNALNSLEPWSKEENSEQNWGIGWNSGKSA